MRVIASEVRQIMENCTLDDQTIDAFIVGANELVTQVYAGDITMTTKLLKEIEKWFTAHMIASTIQRTATEEEVGDARVKYTGYFSKKLESTPYGQMVLTLDISGKMSKAGKTAISIKAIIEDYTDTE